MQVALDAAMIVAGYALGIWDLWQGLVRMVAENINRRYGNFKSSPDSRF